MSKDNRTSQIYNACAKFKEQNIDCLRNRASDVDAHLDAQEKIQQPIFLSKCLA